MGLLRFILAYSVLLHHFPRHPFQLFNGGVAVQAFFIISGFYMTYVINEKYSKGGKGWVSEFYVSRLMRLFPAYIAVLLVILAFYHHDDVKNVFSADHDVTPQAHLVLIFLNLLVVGQDVWQVLIEHSATGIRNVPVDAVIGFLGSNSLSPIYILVGQAWSLSVELIFYAVAPFVVLSRKRLVFFLLAFLGVRFYFLLDLDSFPNGPWRSKLFASNLPLFALGGMSYWIYCRVKGVAWSARLGKLLLIAGLMAIAVSVWLTGGVFLFSGQENYDELRLWLFYIGLMLAIPFLFSYSAEKRLDGFIGELSYPLYLVHGIILGSVFGFMGNQADGVVLLVASVMSILASIVVYQLIDRPVDKVRHRWAASFRSAGMPGALVCGGLVSLVVVMSAVWAVREDPLIAQVAKIEVPYLVETVGDRNIVRLGEVHYVVRHGVDVDWRRSDISSIPGVQRFAGLDEARHEAEPFRDRGAPELLESVGMANVVRMGKGYYAIRHGVEVDWSQKELERPGDVLRFETLELARQAARDMGISPPP